MIRLIASDLDNTALWHGKLSHNNRLAIEKAIRGGVEFVVATGRGLSGVPEVFYEIEGFRYAITSNGSCVYDVRTGERLRHEVISEEEARALFDIGQSLNVTYEIFVEGNAYVDSSYYDDPVRFGQFEEHVPYIKSTRKPVCNIVKFIEEHIGEVENFVFVTPNKEVHEEVSRLVKSRCPQNVLVDNEPQWVEVMSTRSGKGQGLLDLCRIIGVDISEACAIGDNDNDIDMLKTAGFAVAMGNGSSGALAQADYVTRDVIEDGLSYAIEYVCKLKNELKA